MLRTPPASDPPRPGRTAVTRRLAILALSLVVPVLAAAEPAVPAAAAAAAAPQQRSDAARQVAKLQQALLGVMKDAKALGYEGRFQRLQPVVEQVFDLPFMAEKSVGRHWAAAGEQNQQALVATF